MMAPGAPEPAPSASALERTTAAGASGHRAGQLDGRAYPGGKFGTAKKRELAMQRAAEQESSDGTPVWPSGFTTASLFTKVSHLVTKSFCVFDVPVKGCKTKDNVTVTIDCSIVFRIMGDANKDEDPSLVRKFVHEVTPAGLEQQLKDAMAEEVRSLARALKHTVSPRREKEAQKDRKRPTSS